MDMLVTMYASQSSRPIPGQNSAEIVENTNPSRPKLRNDQSDHTSQ